MKMSPVSGSEKGVLGRFHHLGLICSDLSQSIDFFRNLGFECTSPVLDPFQKVEVSLATRLGDPVFELIMPSGDDGPGAGWLKRIQGGVYHFCFECESIADGLKLARNLGLMAISKPSKSPVFGGRSVVFCWSQKSGLVELISKANEPE